MDQLPCSSSHEVLPKTHPSKSTDSSSPSPTPLSSPDTTITEPEQSPGADEDVWDTSSDHFDASVSPHQDVTASDSQFRHDNESASASRSSRSDILSDLPALRRQHMTDGYREGLSIGKARVMQSGFDAGYPMGVEIGLRVGNVLGLLEGIIAALTSVNSTGRSMKGKGKGMTVGSKGVGGVEGEVEQGSAKVGDYERQQSSNTRNQDEDLKSVRSIYTRAQEELKISELLKRLDDEKIASIPDAPASGTAQIDKQQEAGESKKVEVFLPQSVEEVLVKWETLVFGALGRKPGR